MDNFYKTRRHQFSAFRRAFVRESGVRLTQTQSRLLTKLLRDVAICACCEERSRAIDALRSGGGCREIVSVSVNDVLGYTRKEARRG